MVPWHFPSLLSRAHHCEIKYKEKCSDSRTSSCSGEVPGVWDCMRNPSYNPQKHVSGVTLKKSRETSTNQKQTQPYDLSSPIGQSTKHVPKWTKFPHQADQHHLCIHPTPPQHQLCFQTPGWLLEAAAKWSPLLHQWTHQVGHAQLLLIDPGGEILPGTLNI